MFLDLQKKLTLRRRHAMRGVARLLGKRAHSAASARTPGYGGLRHVVDRDVGGDHALAAVLEGDLGLGEDLGRAVVERLDQRKVAPADRAPPHFLGPRELSVVRIELFVEDQEAADLARPPWSAPGEVLVHLAHVRRHDARDVRMGRELLVGAVGDVVPLRPARHRHEVDVDEGADHVAPVAERHHLLDLGKELELVLDIFRRKERPVPEPPDILRPIEDLEVAGAVEEARVAGLAPSRRRSSRFASPPRHGGSRGTRRASDRAPRRSRRSGSPRPGRACRPSPRRSRRPAAW